MDIKLTGGWNVLDCVLSTCSYCFSLKLEKYLPQLLFLIGFRLALTEGGICMRLEDGSIAEAIALRRLMYRCLAVSSFQIILPTTSLVKQQWPQALEYTFNRNDSFQRPLHELSFCGSTSAARRVWLEEFSCKLRVAQSSQCRGCDGE